jgi:hypothetical protein
MKARLTIGIVTLSLLVTLANYTTSAQVNKSIVDTTKQWNRLQVTQLAHSTQFIKITSKDTIIENKSYNIVQKCYASNDEWHDYAYIREDSGRVYAYGKNLQAQFYSDLGSGEYLLYDFNLSKGDTILLYRDSYPDFPTYFVGCLCVVGDVDSIVVEGEYLKRLQIKRCDYGYDEVIEYWIEGIGSTIDLIRSACGFHEMHYELLCVTQGGVQIYQNPDYNSCYVQFDLPDIDDIDIAIYPTIVKDKFHIATTLQNYSVRIFTENGILISQDKHCNGNKNIETTNWYNGIYICVISDSDGKIVNRQKVLKF